MFAFALEKCNTMTIELSKYKERDMLQMSELADLRQSNALFERVIEQTSGLIESSDRVSRSRRSSITKWRSIPYALSCSKKKPLIRSCKNNSSPRNSNASVRPTPRTKKSKTIAKKSSKVRIGIHALFSFSRSVVDLEKKLDLERQGLKRTNEELMQVQKKARILEMDLKQITTTYNQLSYDHDLFKQSNEQIIEQMESDHQRRTQYDKDLKYLQQQFSNAVNQEKQAQNELNQTRQENQRLMDELRALGHDYENMKTKLIDFEDQVEGKFRFSVDIEVTSMPSF